MKNSEKEVTKGHKPSNTVVLILLVLASAAAAIDIWDGHWLKAASSVLILLGIIALLFARRYQSSRWRVAMLMAFTLMTIFILIAEHQIVLMK